MPYVIQHRGEDCCGEDDENGRQAACRLFAVLAYPQQYQHGEQQLDSYKDIESRTGHCLLFH
ncbi:hypothetical protein, partial [Phocaeicola vulgatus]|uniref:hypothetical protein n=1 Tax=Phocaeicola vulgatus TaxID=821 RepID=UPI001F39D68E